MFVQPDNFSIQPATKCNKQIWEKCKSRRKKPDGNQPTAIQPGTILCPTRVQPDNFSIQPAKKGSRKIGEIEEMPSNRRMQVALI